jgi:alkylation response protein AidB-like acyl-CoA dehydrogenase
MGAETGSLTLDAVLVPDGALLGEAGRAFATSWKH